MPLPCEIVNPTTVLFQPNTMTTNANGFQVKISFATMDGRLHYAKGFGRIPIMNVAWINWIGGCIQVTNSAQVIPVPPVPDLPIPIYSSFNRDYANPPPPPTTIPPDPCFCESGCSGCPDIIYLTSVNTNVYPLTLDYNTCSWSGMVNSYITVVVKCDTNLGWIMTANGMQVARAPNVPAGTCLPDTSMWIQGGGIVQFTSLTA